jgi:hypothetical protein
MTEKNLGVIKLHIPKPNQANPTDTIEVTMVEITCKNDNLRKLISFINLDSGVFIDREKNAREARSQ